MYYVYFRKYWRFILLTELRWCDYFRSVKYTDGLCCWLNCDMHYCVYFDWLCVEKELIVSIVLWCDCSRLVRLDWGETVSFSYGVVYLAVIVSYGITICCASFEITRLICALFEITRLTYDICLCFCVPMANTILRHSSGMFSWLICMVYVYDLA